MSGVAAALYLAGLLFAAPVLGGREPYRLADRVRDALVLGVAIVALAAACNLLYPVTLWVLLLAANAGALVRKRARVSTPLDLPVLTLAAIALVAWPALIRPQLDGDTLAYHLPNAASWANAHGIWTAHTMYWWYPPASELFASGLYTVAGPFAVGWSGTLAIALLGLRMREWWRANGTGDALLADLAGACAVTLLPLAWQAGSLQNDVLLGALLFDAVVIRDRDPAAAARSACLAALTKPSGWLFAIVALAPRPVLLVLPAACVALWAARDVVLAHTASLAAAPPAGGLWESTIAAHLPYAFDTLARAFATSAPAAAVAFACALLAPVLLRGKHRGLALAACAFAAIFFVLPYSWSNGTPQLASGMSLRFAAPAIVLGLAILAPLARRGAAWWRVAFAAASLYGCGTVIATYWNDIPTASALLFGAVVAICVMLANRLQNAMPIVATACLACIVAVSFAPRDTVGFVRDATPFGVLHSDAFALLAQQRPPRVVVVGVRGGAVLDVDPAATLYDANDASACALAQRTHAVLVAFASSDQSASTNAGRLRDARACGSVLYSDAMSVITASR